MSASAEARQSELDRVTDSQKPSVVLADQLLSVTDLLRSQASLRNALADTTAADSGRRALAEAILASRVTKATLAVVSEAAALRWGSGSRLATAVERQGLRVLFATAQEKGKLDQVEEELFRFGRVVAADNAVRSALDDRNAPLPARQQLVADLIAKKADALTVKLAQRALVSSHRALEPTLEDYLFIAAEIRHRSIAEVTVARPLTEAQEQRLEALLVARLGRPVNLQVVVDPNVLGGARVKVGDEVIEGTVAGRLAAAEDQLTQ